MPLQSTYKEWALMVEAVEKRSAPEGILPDKFCEILKHPAIVNIIIDITSQNGFCLDIEDVNKLIDQIYLYEPKEESLY